MRRFLVGLGVAIGLLVASLTSASAASAAVDAAPAASAPSAVVVAASEGCKDPNNWWDNLRINAGSMDYCDVDLNWPWSAGDAVCSVASSADGIPELVNCTGAKAETSGTTECWINVPTTTKGVQASSTTVCTSSTDPTHRDTIKAVVATDPNTLQGHCGMGDGACAMFEGWSRAMMSDAVGSLVSILGSGKFTTEGALWDAASGEWSYWVWAVLGVMFCAVVWSITQAMASKDRAELITAVGRSLAAFPMTLFTYWLGTQVVAVFDEWTLYTLTRGDSLAGVFRRLSQVIYAGGEGHYVMTFLITLAIWVGTKLLILVFALRTLGLAALMMVGPVVWMMFPVRGIGPQWVVGYFSAGFTLLLSGPLTMAFIMLIMRGLGNLTSLWSPEAWPLLLGLILVVFAPFAVMSMFSFAGAAAADRLGSSAAHAGRVGINATRGAGRQMSGLGQQAQRWASIGRSNASPAGINSNRRRPNAAGRTGNGSRPQNRNEGASKPRPGGSTPKRTQSAPAGRSGVAPQGTSRSPQGSSTPPPKAGRSK